ncbi:MAG TPA: manganese efflux pump [Candidatus Onthovicinus excrementipullorum]|nr:manganese efflux pump [Candidatus Onthovicinus excrementipullorum]
MDFLLAAALCMDTLFVCISYGASGIRIPILSRIILSAVPAAAFALSLLAGTLLSAYIPARAFRWVGFSVLLLIGLQNLFGGKIKSYLRRRLDRGVTFRLKNLSVALSICADSRSADLDRSRTLSPKEALLLSLSVSLDSLVTGLSVSTGPIRALCLIAFALLFSVAICCIGIRAGQRLGEGRHDFSCIGGLLLIGLAFTKLF